MDRKLLRGIWVLLLFICLSCSKSNELKYPEGQKLASQYCSSCHEIPGPDALSEDLWRQILPRMAARLGRNFTKREAEHYEALRILGMNVTEPVISDNDWNMLAAYYLENSPDTLPSFETDISEKGLDFFKPRLINVTGQAPAASLVKFDSTGFWYGDARSNRVYFYDLKTEKPGVIEVKGAPSDLIRHNEVISILTMGNIFPNDASNGQLLTFNGSKDAVITLDHLDRPVKVKSADLNNDGNTDFLVCGFGHLSGELAWYEGTSDGFEKHVLRAEPGSINAYVLDLNEDGHKDILALMAQGREGFYAYLGDSKGNFTEKEIYTFPSYFGSSYFELKDMNSDGLLDIIYANGDTGDYDYPALKPYHAVRILIQEEPLLFREAYSYPVHGPFNSMAEDYDLDGDIDIAVTSYFPDFKNTPEEGFLLLENEGDMTFKARSMPEAAWGNWLSADRADFDGDGDIDILLGNGPVIRSKVDAVIARKWRDHPNSVILLENLSADR